LFHGLIDDNDEISFCLSGSLNDKTLYYVFSTQSGKLILVPFFIDSSENKFRIYFGNLNMSSVKSLEIINGNLLCCSHSGSLSIVNFNKIDDHIF
jgi:hypothetical protein